MQVARRRRRKSHANRARRNSQSVRSCSHTFCQLLPATKKRFILAEPAVEGERPEAGTSDKTSEDLAVIPGNAYMLKESFLFLEGGNGNSFTVRWAAPPSRHKQWPPGSSQSPVAPFRSDWQALRLSVYRRDNNSGLC